MNPNIAARLAELAATHPDKVAIVDWRGGRRHVISFGELARRTGALAAGLASRGIRPGDSVLLFIPMSIDLYVALLGALHLGGRAVFVDAWSGRARLDAAVAAARPRAFLAIPKAHLLRLGSPALRAVPISLLAGGLWPLARLERPGDVVPAAIPPADEPALVTFTTGSTGKPKAAARSHAFLWAQHLVLAEHLGLRADDIDLATLPVFVLNNLAAGVTSVIPDFDPRRPGDIPPEKVLANIRAERVTTLVASPGFCETLARWAEERREKLPLRALWTGGAPVLPPLLRRLVATVAGKSHVVYGSTEAEPISGIEARAMLAEAHTTGEGLCVGRPIERITVRILRAHDGPIALGAGGWAEWDVAPGETGEIVVSGDHVLTGYLNDPEADRENKIRDGARVWHRTGDAGRLDAEGRLWLMGRVKRRVQRENRMWWPLPAEVRALRVPGVAHAAYFGRPEKAAEQRAVLCIERIPSTAAPARDALAAAIDPWPLDELHLLDHIPRDPRHQSKTDFEALLLRLP